MVFTWNFGGLLLPLLLVLHSRRRDQQRMDAHIVVPKAGFARASGDFHWAPRFPGLGIPEASVSVHFRMDALQNPLTLLEVQSLICGIHLLTSLSLITLWCWADVNTPVAYEQLGAESNGGKVVFPEWKSSAISALLLWYASTMIWKGLKTRVGYEQLWELNADNKAITLRNRFIRTGEGRGLGSRRVFFWRLILSSWEYLATPILLSVIVTIFRYSNSLFLRLANEVKRPLQ